MSDSESSARDTQESPHTASPGLTRPGGDFEIPCSARCADVDVCRAYGCSFRALDEKDA